MWCKISAVVMLTGYLPGPARSSGGWEVPSTSSHYFALKYSLWADQCTAANDGSYWAGEYCVASSESTQQQFQYPPELNTQ